MPNPCCAWVALAISSCATRALSIADRQKSCPKMRGDLVFRICCSRTVVITNSRVFLTPTGRPPAHRRGLGPQTRRGRIDMPQQIDRNCRVPFQNFAQSAAVHSGRLARWQTAETTWGSFGTSSLGGRGGFSVFPINCRAKVFPIDHDCLRHDWLSTSFSSLLCG